MRTRIHRAEYESAASLHAKVNTPSAGRRARASSTRSVERRLIPLHRLGEGVPAQVLVKLESLNPGRQHQGSRRRGHGRGGRTARLAAARRHDHRGHGRQHGRRVWRWRPRSRGIAASSSCRTR